jgi:LacI family transcriptional regulator
MYNLYSKTNNMKNLTMKDIAEKAGVSISTVSHVINKTRHVNQETLDIVLAVMNEMNYQKIRTPRTNGRRINIGVIIADIREDYYIDLLKAIETVAVDYGISIIFCDSESDSIREENNLRALMERNVSGIILAPIEAASTPEILTSISIPIVLVDRQYESHKFLFVGINNFLSGYSATKYLLQKNCKNIGFIGYSETVYTIKQRSLGYKACLMEYDEKMISKLLTLNMNSENSFSIIKHFIADNDLDGLICVNSNACNEVLEVLDSLSTRTQKKLKIISYDDNRWLDYVKFPISVISQPIAEIGNAAVENLLQLIDRWEFNDSVKKELLFDTKIIDRVK